MSQFRSLVFEGGGVKGIAYAGALEELEKRHIVEDVTALAHILPFLGSLVEIGFAIVAFFFSAIVSILVIATAWIVYRPVLDVALIVAAIGCIVLLKRLESFSKLGYNILHK